MLRWPIIFTRIIVPTYTYRTTLKNALILLYAHQLNYSTKNVKNWFKYCLHSHPHFVFEPVAAPFLCHSFEEDF